MSPPESVNRPESAERGATSPGTDNPTVDPDLRQAAVQGLAWTAAGRLAQQFILVAGTAVLARIVTPADFGLVAMIAIFTGFVVVFGDLGLSAALVQRREVTQAELSSVFWLTAAGGVLLAAVLSAAAPLFVSLYDQSRLLELTPIIALSLPLGALSAVHAARTQRALDFKRFAIIESMSMAIAYAAAIAAAAAGAGVWSLVVLSLARAGAQTAMFWALDPWRPTLELDRRAARGLLRFGGNLAGSSTVAYWINNADNLLVGVFAGQRALGLYSRAFTLMQTPLAQAAWAAERVMFPTLTRLGEDRARVKRAYLRAVSLIAFVALPLVTALVIAAEPLVLTLLGPSWRGSIELFRILAVGGMIQAVATTGTWIYLSQGRTDWLFRWNLVNAPFSVAAFAIGVHWGVTGVAWAFLIRTVLIAVPSLAIPGRLIDLRLREVSRALVPTVASCAVMAAVLVPVDRVFSSAPAGAWLAGDLLVGAAVYLGLAVSLRLRAYQELRAVVDSLVGRRNRLATT